MKIKDAGKYVTWIENDDGIEVPVTNDIVTGLMKLGAQAQRENSYVYGFDGYEHVGFDDIDPLQVLRQAAEEKKG